MKAQFRRTGLPEFVTRVSSYILGKDPEFARTNARDGITAATKRVEIQAPIS